MFECLLCAEASPGCFRSDRLDLTLSSFVLSLNSRKRFPITSVCMRCRSPLHGLEHKNAHDLCLGSLQPRLRTLPTLMLADLDVEGRPIFAGCTISVDEESRKTFFCSLQHTFMNNVLVALSVVSYMLKFSWIQACYPVG